MLDEILYKEQLDLIKDYVKKHQYISISKINEIFESFQSKLDDEKLHLEIIVKKDKTYNLVSKQGEELIPNDVVDSIYLKTNV